jgi:inhibitor of cysteine peptidase
MKEEMKNIIVVGSVLLVAIAFLVFSLWVNPIKTNVPQSEVGKFSSVEELRAFLEENSQDGYYGGIAKSFDAARTLDAAESSDNAAAPSATGAGQTADEYSQTNIQVQGVDEPDIVKNDGEYIYTASGNKVVIVDAYPADGMGIASEIDFGEDYVSNLFLNDDKLVVFVGHYEYVDSGIRCNDMFSFGVRCGGYSREETRVYVYDISDRENPSKEDEFDFSGNYVDARMIDNYVYLISSKSVYRNYLELPYYRINGDEVKIGASDISYIREPDESYVFDTIAAIDIGSGEVNTETYLWGYSNSIYVSADNVYITYQKQISQESIIDRYLDEVLLPALPNKVANEIKDVWEDDDKTLSEKESEIGDIFGNYLSELETDEMYNFQSELENKAFEFFKEIEKEQEKTVIHRIGVDGLNIEHEAGGEVPGRVLNQFSMDEYDESFRIATTTGGWDASENENNVYVLNLDLNAVGKLEGLAKGEQIYSARFMGERAYLVTFRQTDPLFVVDLSVPTEPKVIGELKVTGYSGYLHPYDENYLLGIGMEASTSGRTQGVKVSLFDVSDFENPREVGKYVVEKGWSSSDAVYDAKAVLFDKERNLLVIPVSYNEETSGKWDYWQGAYVFDVDLNGIELKGTITHQNGSEYYSGYVRRSLFMDDVLYTVSDVKIKANWLSDLSSISEVELPYGFDGRLYATGGAEPAIAVDDEGIAV